MLKHANGLIIPKTDYDAHVNNLRFQIESGLDDAAQYEQMSNFRAARAEEHNVCVAVRQLIQMGELL